MRVVFPLPNGNANVFFRPTTSEDGSLTLSSRGQRFGDPGFYFFVERREGGGWARYVRTFCEDIHVYVDELGDVRANHDLEIWGTQVAELQYSMKATR